MQNTEKYFTPFFILNKNIDTRNALFPFLEASLTLTKYINKNEQKLTYFIPPIFVQKTENSRFQLLLGSDVINKLLPESNEICAYVFENSVNTIELLKIILGFLKDKLEFKQKIKIIHYLQSQISYREIAVDFFPILEISLTEIQFSMLNKMEQKQYRLYDLFCDQKISLKTALLYQDWDNRHIDRLMQLFPENLTFSELNQLMTLVYESFRMSDKPVNAFLTQIHMLFTGTEIKTKNDLKSVISKLRYPLYSQYEEKFKEFIKNLSLPKGVKIEPDANFEGISLTFIIKTTNEKLLTAQTTWLMNRIEDKMILEWLTKA